MPLSLTDTNNTFITTLLLGGSGLAGLVLGSFVTTAALRSITGGSALTGRSGCDHCGRTLGWTETLPVISMSILKGRCRTCRGRIDASHLAGEISGALCVTLPLALVPLPQGLIVAAIGLILLASSVIDAKTCRLPNVLTFAVLLSGAALTLLRGEGLAALGWAVGVFLTMKGVQYLLSRRLKTQALGEGDIKLVAALALWLGSGIVYALCLACVSALLFIVARRHKGLLPFGPFVATGAFLVGLQLESHVLHGVWLNLMGGV